MECGPGPVGYLASRIGNQMLSKSTRKPFRRLFHRGVVISQKKNEFCGPLGFIALAFRHTVKFIAESAKKYFSKLGSHGRWPFLDFDTDKALPIVDVRKLVIFRPFGLIFRELWPQRYFCSKTSVFEIFFVSKSANFSWAVLGGILKQTYLLYWVWPGTRGIFGL